MAAAEAATPTPPSAALHPRHSKACPTTSHPVADSTSTAPTPPPAAAAAARGSELSASDGDGGIDGAATPPPSPLLVGATAEHRRWPSREICGCRGDPVSVALLRYCRIRGATEEYPDVGVGGGTSFLILSRTLADVCSQVRCTGGRDRVRRRSCVWSKIEPDLRERVRTRNGVLVVCFSWVLLGNGDRTSDFVFFRGAHNACTSHRRAKARHQNVFLKGLFRSPSFFLVAHPLTYDCIGAIVSSNRKHRTHLKGSELKTRYSLSCLYPTPFAPGNMPLSLRLAPRRSPYRWCSVVCFTKFSQVLGPC